MDPLIPLFAFIVTIFIFIVIKANIEYRKDLKKHKNIKTEEEKDEEWLNNQW